MDVRGLGEYIRKQRESSRLSLRNLSTLAGVSGPYLSQVERGLRRPSAEILLGIAKGLVAQRPCGDDACQAVAQVLGKIDGGHPALAELALDPIAVGEGGCETRDGVRRYRASASEVCRYETE